jgi:prolyl oligopeptidase
MKNDEEPDWQWHMGVSELDGRYLELYINKDTSRVRA